MIQKYNKIILVCFVFCIDLISCTSSEEFIEEEASYYIYLPVEEAKRAPFVLKYQNQEENFYSVGTLMNEGYENCGQLGHLNVRLVHESELWMVVLYLPWITNLPTLTIYEQESMSCTSSFLPDMKAGSIYVDLRDGGTVTSPRSRPENPANLESWFVIENVDESQKQARGNLDVKFVLEEESIHLEGDFHTFLQILPP